MGCIEVFSDWPVERLEAELCSLSARVAAATCGFLLAVGEYDRRRGWEVWECRDMAAWLSWRCGITPVTAREQVRVARALDEFSLVRERFGEGRLSYSQVRAIVRVVTPETEEALVELAAVSTAAQLETITRAFRRSCRQSAETAEARHRSRFLRYGWDDDGNLVGSFCLPAEEGAALIRAVEGAVPAGRMAEADADGARDSYGAVRADALVELVSAGAGRDGDDDFDSSYLVTVVADESGLQGDTGEGPMGECRVDDGPGLASETVQRLVCDAAVVTVVEDGRGGALDLGRRTRRPSRALRRAMRLRDGHCQFPGCECRRVQAHHMRRWGTGGPTSLDNLVSLCRFHHRRVHEGGYRVLLDQRGGRHFYHPAGYELQPTPSIGPAPDDSDRYYQGIHPYESGWDGSRLDLGLTLDCLHQHGDSAESTTA